MHRKIRAALLGFSIIVALLVFHAIHDGHRGRGNAFVWLVGRMTFSTILYFHPYYQVTALIYTVTLSDL